MEIDCEVYFTLELTLKARNEDLDLAELERRTTDLEIGRVFLQRYFYLLQDMGLALLLSKSCSVLFCQQVCGSCSQWSGFGTLHLLDSHEQRDP